MADSQQNIDWNKVHQAALECLHAIWELIWWAERSTEEDYDVGSAALHLAAIDRAGDTVGRAIGMFRPHHFDALAKASVGEGPRPDFQFGGVCCATAHESAFVLLRTAGLWVENGLWAQGIGAIDQLHELSVETLRDKLLHLGNPKAIKSLLTRRQSNVIKAWIDREWAAVVNRDIEIIDSPNDNLWSKPNTLKHWAAKLDCSRDTLKRRFEDDSIRYEELPKKKFKILIEDLRKYGVLSE